jgi:peptide/nickel transport system substrate-binding protein
LPQLLAGSIFHELVAIFLSVLQRNGHDESDVLQVVKKATSGIQQDLSQIGIKVNLVTLDFPSLIERITRTYDYEACLLGLVNTDLDPNSQMNVWLSSAENHQWNPKQSKAATMWEAELDRLMHSQASATSDKKRKADWDKVQQIVAEQQPFIYLVNKDAMSAISSAVADSSPSVLDPPAFWNAELLRLKGDLGLGAQK